MFFVDILHHLQDQLLPLFFAQVDLLRSLQIQVQSSVRPTRGANGDLWKDDFADRPRVHGGDDGRGGPRVERLVDQTDPDAEARDHDQNPDDSRIDVPPLGNVRQAVDRGRLKELVNFTFDAHFPWHKKPFLAHSCFHGYDRLKIVAVYVCHINQ